MSERTAKITLTALLLLLMMAAFNPIPTINRVSADSTFRIKQRNPVVNEEKKLKLTATDLTGNPISGVVWESGSSDIAEIDPQSGVVTGKSRGFATITARRGSETSSVFIVVARVKKGPGAKVPGDTKVDTSGNIYISNPNQNVILKADNELTAPTQIYAGKPSQAGQRNGNRLDSLFSGPTAIGVDNRPQGGLFVTDTLNHVIRKISFNGLVETSIGNGTPGTTSFDSRRTATFDQTVLRSPRGVVADAGGNIFLADTDNHAVYYIDFTNRKSVLIAGEPGQLGKSDGNGRAARFQRPSGLALSSDGRLLSVADQDNNRVRLIELKRDSNNELLGEVTTIGTAPGSANLIANNHSTGTAEIEFNKPQSVSFDGAGNLYVVDDDGVQVVTQPLSQNAQVVALAQPGESFQQAASIVVKGTESFVLDAEAATAAEAINVVSVGGPEILSVTPDIINMSGDAEITVMGKNFAPESVVTFGDNLISDARVVSATEIRFRAGVQKLPGVRTLSILTRGGLAQRELNIAAKPAWMLAKGEITTIAGGAVFTGDGGLATQASIGAVTKVLVDGAGNIFLADFTSGNVRQIEALTKKIFNVAGGGASLDDNIPANIAKIEPFTIALDREGNIFIGDALTYSVRRIDAITKQITTIAGGMRRPIGGDGGPARLAGLGAQPIDIAFDKQGNLFILAANRVRRVDVTTGIITTVVGNDTFIPVDNVPAEKSGLNSPAAIAFDSNDNLHISDSGNQLLRRIDAKTNIITTIAGTGSFTDPDTIDGQPATSVGITSPIGLAFDSDDNLIFINEQTFLRLDKATGTLQRIRFQVSDPKSFKYPTGRLALDGDGNIFFTDINRLQKLDIRNNRVSVIAGGSRLNFRGDGGPAAYASIGLPTSPVTDAAGNLYLADFGNGLVRKIEVQTGRISTVVGSDPKQGQGNGDGGPANHAIVQPDALAIAPNGDLFIADGFFRTIRKVDQLGTITTFAGTGTTQIDGDGKPAIKAGLGIVTDIAIDNKGNLLIAGGGYIRRVDMATGIINTVVAYRNAGATVGPLSIAVDAQGNIYSAFLTNTVDRIDKHGRIRRFAGSDKFTPIDSGDGGPARKAGLGLVNSIAVQNGQLYIGTYQFFTTPTPNIRKVDIKTGIISTVISSNQGEYSGDGGPAITASLAGFPEVHVDKNGNIFIINLDFFTIASVRMIKN